MFFDTVVLLNVVSSRLVSFNLTHIFLINVDWNNMSMQSLFDLILWLLNCCFYEMINITIVLNKEYTQISVIIIYCIVKWCVTKNVLSINVSSIIDQSQSRYCTTRHACIVKRRIKYLILYIDIDFSNIEQCDHNIGRISIYLCWLCMLEEQEEYGGSAILIFSIDIVTLLE